MSAVNDIEIDKGHAYDLAINFSDDIDRTGYSFAGQVREVATASGTAEATFTFDDSSMPTTLHCVITAVDTADLDPLKRYVYDIVQTDDAGASSVLIRGYAKARQVVTK